MTNILHKISPKHTRIIAAALSLVMVLGAVCFVAPVEAQALSINASDSGFYNLAYGTGGETTFGDGTQIRVINQTREGKSKSDAVYKLSGVNWSAANESNYLVWDNSKETNTFYGIYPYNAEYKTFTIPTDQEGGVQDADWMTATYTGAETSSVKLHFEHRLAKVTVNIKEWNSEFDGSEKVIENPMLYSKGSDITAAYSKDASTGATTAAITSDEESTGITPLEGGNTENPTFTAIVAPNAAYAGTDEFMTFDINGEEYTVLAKADELTAGLRPGYHYTFNLTVGKDKVELTSVNVTDWKDGGTIDGVVAKEKFVIYSIDTNQVATFIIRDEATVENVKAEVESAIASGATTLMFDTHLDETTQNAVAEFLANKTGINLLLSKNDTVTASVSALDIDLAYKNGQNDNGYALTKSGGYIITSKDGLNNWRNAASQSPYNTNLTLACDIEYHGRWYAFDPNTRYGYTGVIDGNGYAIKGLRCTQVIASTAGSIRNTFIDTLGEGGVIKNLGLSGGICKNTDSSLDSGGFGFVGYNYGVIMGCYNANECKTEISSGYGHAAGISFDNYGVIIGCYNIGNISTNIGDYSAGIAAKNNTNGKILACYNTGSITGEKPAGIVGTNMYKSSVVSDCYYRGATLGVYNEKNTTTPSTTTRLASIDLNDGVSKMNAAIEAYNKTATVKCNYRYEINTDSATKDAKPFIIVEAQ